MTRLGSCLISSVVKPTKTMKSSVMLSMLLDKEELSGTCYLHLVSLLE